MKTADADQNPLLDESTITEILNLQADSIFKQYQYYRSPLATIDEYGSNTSSSSDYKDDIALLRQLYSTELAMNSTSDENETFEDDSSTSYKSGCTKNAKKIEHFNRQQAEGQIDNLLAIIDSETSIPLNIIESTKDTADIILKSESIKELLAESELKESESFQNLLKDLGEFNTYSKIDEGPTNPPESLLKYACLKNQNEKQNKEISSGDKEMLYRACDDIPKQNEVIGSGDIPERKSETKSSHSTKSRDEKKSERKHHRSKSRDGKSKNRGKKEGKKREKVVSESESTNVSSTISMSSTNSLILRNKFHFTQEYTPYNYTSLAKELLSKDSEVPIYNTTFFKIPEIPPPVKASEKIPKTPFSETEELELEPVENPMEYPTKDNDIDDTSNPQSPPVSQEEPQNPNITKRQFLEELTRSIVDSETYFQRCLTELNKCAAKVVKHKEEASEDPKDITTKPIQPIIPKALPTTKERSHSTEISEKVKEIEQTMKDIDENKIQSQIKVVNKKYKEELTTLIEKLKFLASYRKRVSVRPSRKRKVTKEKMELMEKAKKKEQELLTNNDFEEIVTQMECDTSGKATTSQYTSSEIQKSVQKVVEWKKSSGVGKNDIPDKMRKSELTHSDSSVDSKAKSSKNHTFVCPSVKNSSSKTSFSRKSKKMSKTSNSGLPVASQGNRGVHKHRSSNSTTSDYKTAHSQKRSRNEPGSDPRKNVIDVRRDNRYKKALEKVIKYSEKPATIPPINVIDQDTLNMLRDECMKLQKNHKPVSKDYPKLRVDSAAVAQSMDEESRLLSTVTPEAVAPFVAEYSKQKKKPVSTPSETQVTDTKNHPLSKFSPSDTASKTINLSQIQYLQNLITDPNARFKTTMTIMPVTVKNTFKPRPPKRETKETKDTKVEAEKPFDYQAPRRVDFFGIKSNVKSPVKAYISGIRKNVSLNPKTVPKSQVYQEILRVPDDKRMKMGTSPTKSKPGPFLYSESGRQGSMPPANPPIQLPQPPPKSHSMPSPVITANISHHIEPVKKPETINSLIEDILSLTRPTRTAQIKHQQAMLRPQVRPVNKSVVKLTPQDTKNQVKSPVVKPVIGVKNIDVTKKISKSNVNMIKDVDAKESKSMENVEFLKYVEASILSKRSELKSVSRENLAMCREMNKGVMDLTGMRRERRELMVSKSSENLDKEKSKLRPLSSSGSEGSLCDKIGKKKPRGVGTNRNLEVKGEDHLDDVPVHLTKDSAISADSSSTTSRLSNLAQPRQHYVRAHCEEYKHRLGKTFTDRMGRFIEKPDPELSVKKNFDNTIIPTSNSILFDNVMHALENVIDSSGVNKAKLKVFNKINSQEEAVTKKPPSPLRPQSARAVCHGDNADVESPTTPKNRPMSQPRAAYTPTFDVRFSDDHPKNLSPLRRSRLIEAAKSPRYLNSDSFVKTMNVMSNLQNHSKSVPDKLTSVEEANNFINNQLDFLLKKEIVSSKTYTALQSDEEIFHSFHPTNEKMVVGILDTILDEATTTSGDANLQVTRSTDLLYEKCSSSTLFLKLEEILSQESNLTTSNSSTTVFSYVPLDVNPTIKSTQSKVTVLHPLKGLPLHYIKSISYIKDEFYRVIEFNVATNYYKIQNYASHFRYLMDTFYPIYTMCVDNLKSEETSSQTSFLPRIESDEEDCSSSESELTLSGNALELIGFGKSRESVNQLAIKPINPIGKVEETSSYKSVIESLEPSRSWFSSCKETESESRQNGTLDRNMERKEMMVFQKVSVPFVVHVMNLSSVIIEWELIHFTEHNLPAPMDVIFTGSGDGGNGNLDQMPWVQLYNPKGVPTGKSSSLSVCVSQTTGQVERSFVATTLSNSSINTFLSLGSSKSMILLNDGEKDEMEPLGNNKETKNKLATNDQVLPISSYQKQMIGKFLVNSSLETVAFNSTKGDSMACEQMACRDVTLFVFYGLLFVCVFSCLTVQPSCS